MLERGRSHRQHMNECASLCFDKTLFTKPSGGPDFPTPVLDHWMLLLLVRGVGVDEYKLCCRKNKFISYLMIEVTLLVVDIWKKRKKAKQQSLFHNYWAYTSFSWFCCVLTYLTFLVVGHLDSSFHKEGDEHFGVKALSRICFFKPCFSRSEISGSKVVDPDCQMAFRKWCASGCSS